MIKTNIQTCQLRLALKIENKFDINYMQILRHTEKRSLHRNNSWADIPI